ncbi:MAG: hypothetical protein U0R50_01065 [Gaiellales bacterium]
MLERALMVVVILVGGVAVLLTAIAIGMRRRTPLAVEAVRRFSRRVVNPLQLKTAGRPGAYAGIIRHVGRKTGRQFETPVGPFPTAEGFVIALPYGTRSNWVKNVLAAGSATLVTEGEAYEVDRPELVALADVVAALPAKEQRSLRRFGVHEALRVHRRGRVDGAGAPMLER